MSRLQLAINQLVFARKYTVGLLDQTPVADWFRLPPAGISHVGWQVGHLSFAEFRMALWRIRGQRPDDEELVSQEFIRLFGAKSVPDADATKYPTAAALRAKLDQVHERALAELSSLAEAALDEPVAHPHPLAKTKMESILWCAHHEMLHAGQIGLLRRQLGHPLMW
jgi:hypothetical protein